MTRFSAALVATVACWLASLPYIQGYQAVNHRTAQGRFTMAATARSVSTSSWSDEGGDGENSVRKARSYIQSLNTNMWDEDLSDDDEAEAAVARQRLRRQSALGSFRVRLGVSSTLGVSLRQVSTGRELSQEELSLDSLQISTSSSSRTAAELEAGLARLDPSYTGLMVSAVAEDSVAFSQGVRVGQVLVSMSATLGDSLLWPKESASLEAVRLALDSRQAIQTMVDLEFQIVKDADTQYYTLTLTRPLGFTIQESEDGHVEVCAIQENASNLVRHAIQEGDRVVAVDAAIGGKMWPVSTVEGVISACTGRLPGKPVTIRFERPPAVAGRQEAVQESVRASSSLEASTTSVMDVPTQVPAAKAGKTDQKELIKRCRDVLRRYAADNQKTKIIRSTLTGIPAIVADKVVDALASASAVLDSYTLSLIMNAYLSCGQPLSAIVVFEAAVGFAGNGSSEPVTDILEGKSGGRLMPSDSALNLYTATALLHAHSMNGDIGSVLRVLAAMEGQSGEMIDGLESAPWPFTGTYGSIKPDTQCYNIAIAAAEKIGGEDALVAAVDLFENLANPKDAEKTDRPVRDVVTFNTVISALTNGGLANEAFRMFDRMKQSGVRPDKYTYTSLIKACVLDGDIQELLYDMKERGIEADVVTYNTIIRLLCDKRQWTQATRLVTEMESRGITPNSMTYGYLMSAMLKADKPSACLALFESACASQGTVTLTENVYLFTTAITAASMLGNHERALELVSRMTAKGIRPNLKTLTAVVGACLSSNKPDLAAEVYRKIDKPDGYAMAQGIRALCGAGDLEAAFSILQSQRRGNGSLTGKQLMASYQAILKASLERDDLDMARLVIGDLMKKGNIPNKAMLMSIVEIFEIGSLKQLSSRSSEGDADRFAFLLFVVDLVLNRNLPVEGVLYTAVLTLGRCMGGDARRIAQLMVKARTTAGKEKQLMPSMIAGEEEEALDFIWEDCWRTQQFDKQPIVPSLPVRVGPRDIRRVMATEMAVTKGKREQPAQQSAVLAQ